MDSAALAPFERIAHSIREDIRRGVLNAGDKLPSQRDLATEHGVASATVQNALRHLQDEGWLTPRAGVGVFVNRPPANASSGPNTLDAVSSQVAELQTTVADLAERLRKVENQHSAS